MEHRPPQGTFAAIDLGSNSFHMLIARVVDGEITPVDRLREWVQLGAGLDEKNRLRPEAERRALACLQRFGQRLQDHPASAVRAVGTNALRKARNAEGFLDRARQALGHPIKIIPGSEEARLIYLGVAHSFYDDAHRRLIVDIGGGSTECILGTGYDVERTASLYMGCVSFTEAYFPGGKIRPQRMKKAVIAARLEMQNIERDFLDRPWSRAIGASGTILAIEEVLRRAGWTDRGVSREGLEKLREALLAAGQAEQVRLPGLRADRAAVLPGGVAILLAIFESLGLEEMLTSHGALREGLLYDLVGRLSDEDVRERTIERFMERYRVDREQAGRVDRTAQDLLGQVLEAWQLDEAYARRNLRWAASLHEIGLAVSHSGFHKHGAYLVAHSDMAGFSLGGQQTLSTLIRGHRRKLTPAIFEPLQPSRAQRALRLCLLLRLAVLLNRSRTSRPLPPIRLKVRKKGLRLAFPEGWLEGHPLVQADLEQEVRAWAALDLHLEYR
ncbi:MAG: exopolyphosphatase [Acidobacteriota bacterium]|nr:exopolyphosphatase [Acidobacteriota bacterium]